MPTAKELEALYGLTRKEIRERRVDLLSYAFGRSTCPGSLTIEARHADFPMPLAVVWYAFPGSETIEIQNSVVYERFRRCGLRTYLHESLLAAYPGVRRIITGSGTASGKAWMRATGYRRVLDLWEYRRPTAKRRKRKGVRS